MVTRYTADVCCRTPSVRPTSLQTDALSHVSGSPASHDGHGSGSLGEVAADALGAHVVMVSA
jgi:hypothetical protein